MVTITTIIRTICSRFLFILFCLLMGVPFLICLLLPRQWLVDVSLFKLLLKFFNWFVIKFSFLPITFTGNTVLPNQPVIVVANHQSSFDVPLIGSLMNGRSYVWLALEELLQSPLLRFILRRVAILVDRSSASKGLRTLVQAITIMNEKPWDLVVFPEGGRFTDGTVHEFMAGFAIIARKTARPVIPVKITGVQKVYPPGSFWVYWYPITVKVGEPFNFQLDESDEAFTQRVYQWFITN